MKSPRLLLQGDLALARKLAAKRFTKVALYTVAVNASGAITGFIDIRHAVQTFTLGILAAVFAGVEKAVTVADSTTSPVEPPTHPSISEDGPP